MHARPPDMARGDGPPPMRLLWVHDAAALLLGEAAVRARSPRYFALRASESLRSAARIVVRLATAALTACTKKTEYSLQYMMVCDLKYDCKQVYGCLGKLGSSKLNSPGTRE